MGESRIIESVNENDLALLKKRPKKFWKDVAVIYAQAFKGCKEIKIIELPNSVKLIGMEAFLNCENLEMIILPRSIKSIEKDAFKGCPLNYVSLMTNGEIILSKEQLKGNGVFVSQNLDVLKKVYKGFSLNNLIKEGHYKIFFALELAKKLNERGLTVNYSELDKLIEQNDKAKENRLKKRL